MTRQAFDSHRKLDVLALDLLGIFLANRVLLRFDMTLVNPLAVGVISCDANGLQQFFELQK